MAKHKHEALNHEYYFLESRKGPLFLSKVSPGFGARHRGTILYLPPFGEEMNKSRRMATLQCREFARIGFVAQMLDLPGCGDSYGVLEEVTWNDWLEASKTCLDTLVNENDGPITVWGLRMGALLCACLKTERKDAINRLLFWQPILDGKSIVSSIFRLARASKLLRQTNAAGPIDDPKYLLSRESVVEIGGYRLSQELVTSIESQSLKHASLGSCKIDWIDVGLRDRQNPSFAAQKLINKWKDGGATVHWSHICGEAFWSTVEISECNALIDTTCHLIERRSPHAQ